MRHSCLSRQSSVQGLRPQTLQAKYTHKRRQLAQGPRSTRFTTRTLGRLRDLEHRWGQLHPGKRREGCSEDRSGGHRPVGNSSGQAAHTHQRGSHAGCLAEPADLMAFYLPRSTLHRPTPSTLGGHHEQAHRFMLQAGLCAGSLSTHQKSLSWAACQSALWDDGQWLRWAGTFTSFPTYFLFY